MPKTTGLGANLYVSGNDLSGDVGAVNTITASRALLPITGIDKSAPERLHGLRDGEVSFQAWFNPAAGQAHPVLSSLPTADRIVSYWHRATAVGDTAGSMVGKQIGYDPNRGQDGSLTIDTQALANGFGLDWGVSLTPGIRTDGGAVNGAVHDYGVTIGQTLFGMQAFLHVFSFTGTDATVTVEDSASDFAGATLASFTEVSVLGGSNTSERISTSRTGTVDRFVRVITTTSGGFSDLQFAVMLVKNETSVLF